jgi:ADP-heptose:LPS heptosyltransferase
MRRFSDFKLKSIVSTQTKQFYWRIDDWLFKLLFAWFTRGSKMGSPTVAVLSAKNILLFKPDGIGDFVLWSEVYKEFSVRHAESNITALVCAPTGELLRSMYPHWRILEIPRRPASTLDFLQMLLTNRRLRNNLTYDLLVDLRVHRVSWETLYIALLNAELKVGFASEDRNSGNLAKHDTVLFGKLIDRPRPQLSLTQESHIHELTLVEAFCSWFWSIKKNRPLPDLRGFFVPTKCFPLKAKSLPEQLTIFHPGSGNPTKNWPPELWRQLIEEVLDTQPKASIAVVVGRRDVNQLGSLWQLKARDRIEWWLNFPLPKLATHLAQGGLFVGHDTGISHLAASVGTPCLLLFGPTNPNQWGPPHAFVKIIRAPEGRLDRLSSDVVLRAMRTHVKLTAA